MEALLELDKNIFLFLNSLGSTEFDFIWMFITDKKSSIPLYVLLLVFLFKKTNNKEFFKYLFFIVLLILFTDQISGFFKDFFQRLRPCHDLSINSHMRLVKEGCGGLYGFFSSHAANSFGIATFFYLTQKKYSNLFKFLFLWALIVSYSRIYIGVHFPIDIVIGICFGIFSGYIFSKINFKFNHNVF